MKTISQEQEKQIKGATGTEQKIHYLYNLMYAELPDFRKFVKENKNKSINQLIIENDLPIELLN